ncbi:hypothetical protein GJ697_05635 [Pseudoduganella sp. FT25W]|jgi:hypothetical protein|uniref:Uncharacterized protein n=1 Tax=Duganella alba TaxID=2666081 RepID=A0A6L5QDE4_9BURK|nr:hypothetical protein [Duganella alba]MRX07312.1 hypothetical protein [Duganella alba]MRX14993.1 hypothetical protein [Duganella alba]
MEKIVTLWRRLIWHARYLISGRIRPDPGVTHEFELVANFAEAQSAEYCLMALQHLNMKSAVARLANGRANATFNFFAKPGSSKFTEARDAVTEAARRHGGEVLLCAVVMRSGGEAKA